MLKRLVLISAMALWGIAGGCTQQNPQPAADATPKNNSTAPAATPGLKTSAMPCDKAFGDMPQLLPAFGGGTAFTTAAPVATLYGDDRRNASYIMPMGNRSCTREIMEWTTWEQRHWALRFAPLKPNTMNAVCGPLAIAWGKSQRAWLVKHLGQISLRMGCPRLAVTMLGLKHKNLLGHNMVICPPAAGSAIPCGIQKPAMNIAMAGHLLTGAASGKELRSLRSLSITNLEKDLPRWIKESVPADTAGDITITIDQDVEWFRLAMLVDGLLTRAPGISLYVAAAMR